MTTTRIQRKRSKGWRMPEGAVCCTRPGPWGNPYKVGEVDEPTGKVVDSAMAIRLYRLTLRQTAFWEWRREMRAKLTGKKLACWCAPGKPCHVDVIIEMLNDADLRKDDEWREQQDASLKALGAGLIAATSTESAARAAAGGDGRGEGSVE